MSALLPYLLGITSLIIILYVLWPRLLKILKYPFSRRKPDVADAVRKSIQQDPKARAFHEAGEAAYRKMKGDERSRRRKRTLCTALCLIIGWGPLVALALLLPQWGIDLRLGQTASPMRTLPLLPQEQAARAKADRLCDAWLKATNPEEKRRLQATWLEAEFQTRRGASLYVGQTDSRWLDDALKTTAIVLIPLSWLTLCILFSLRLSKWLGLEG